MKQNKDIYNDLADLFKVMGDQTRIVRDYFC